MSFRTKTAFVVASSTLGLLAVSLIGTAQTSVSAKAVSTPKVTLEFFQTKAEAVNTWAAIIKQFEKKYPNITVKENNVPNATQVLETRMASGSIPDLFNQYPPSADYRKFAADQST